MGCPSLLPELPKYLGKFPVACVDVETSNGLLARFYYPASVEPNSKRLKWLPDANFYATGYGTSVGVPSFISSLFSAPLLSLFEKPAINSSTLNPDAPKKLPIVVFSHGLLGMRTTYSTLCGNLASVGVLVIALEHADGSASITKRYNQVIHYENLSTRNASNDEREQLFLDFNKKRIQKRTGEIDKLLDFLRDLNIGNLDNVTSKDDLSLFIDRLSLDNMVLIGHSFGGATCISALQNENPFKCSVILDPWMFAVHDQKAPSVPFITIQSQKFHWKRNFRELIDFFNHDNRHHSSEFYVIRDTAHNDVSDFAFLFSLPMRTINLCGIIDPKINQIVLMDTMIHFINQHIDISLEWCQSEHKRYIVSGNDAIQIVFESLVR